MTDNITWKTRTIYMLIIVFMLISSGVFGQVTVKHFNAEWNKNNGADWIMSLKDCQTKSYVDISKDIEAQKKYKIAVVPTIIIFDEGEEIERFQADISFTIKTTREEIQEIIDELVVNKF